MNRGLSYLLMCWFLVGWAPSFAVGVDVSQRGLVQVLRLSGQLIAGSTLELRTAVDQALNSGSSRLVINLARVSSFDSSGLGELVSSYQRVRNQGGQVVLCELSQRELDVLTITQLITVFDVYETESQAIATLGER